MRATIRLTISSSREEDALKGYANARSRDRYPEYLTQRPYRRLGCRAVAASRGALNSCGLFLRDYEPVARPADVTRTAHCD